MSHADDAEEHKMGSFTRYFPVIARILMGLIFFVTGLNGFLSFIPPPKSPIPEGATAFIGALVNTGYLFRLILGTQLIVGILLLLNRFVPLALALIAPIIVGIITFHIFLEPSGLPLASVVFVLEIYLAWAYREAFRPMLVMRITPVRSEMHFDYRLTSKKHDPCAPFAERGRCSFCSKSRTEALKLFDGPDGVHICSECLEACKDILRQYEENPPPQKTLSATVLFKNEILRCSFCLKTEDEVKHLMAGPTVCICGDCAVRFREGIG